ncbi:MAG: SDR family NAD(P)-dependent oxidoreductase, partial [Candidatus Rokuibacteriota bacterium]
MSMISGKMAVVTGGGSGIGRATAQLLGTRGAVVAVVDLDEAGARETAESIAKNGGRAVALRADVSRAAELDKAIDQAIAALGPLEIMVNNAGILDGYFNVDETEEA